MSIIDGLSLIFAKNKGGESTRFGVLVNPDNPFITESFVTELQTAASAIGRQIEVVTASTNGDIDTAFATLVKKRADAIADQPGRAVRNPSRATHHARGAPYAPGVIPSARACRSWGRWRGKQASARAHA
jgi:hypothetical protein